MATKITRLAFCAIIATAMAFAQVNLPHVTWGGGWTANITVVNLDTVSVAAATLSFFGNDGTALAAPVNGGATMSVYNFTLPARGSATIVLPASAGNGVGSGILTTNGPTVAASVMYTYHALDPSKPDYSATVPGISATDTSCLIPTPWILPSYSMPFDNKNGYSIGLAVANSDAGARNVLVEAYDESGSSLGTTTVLLKGYGHKSFALTDQVPAAAGHTGTVVVYDDLRIVGALALQVFPNGTISTILPLGQ